jgi:DNA repair protein RadC
LADSFIPSIYGLGNPLERKIKMPFGAISPSLSPFREYLNWKQHLRNSTKKGGHMKLKFLQVKESQGEKVQSPEAVRTLMSEEAMADRECFWILHLNAANQIIEKELVSVGTVNNSLAHPREVFKKAILNGASGIVTVHNHPSGQSKPSREDNIMWDRLDEAGEILGIAVLDHLILAPGGQYYSRQQGNAFKTEKEY